MAERTPVQYRPPAPAKPNELPFGVEFQGYLLKLILENGPFSRQSWKYLEPKYFQNEAHAWAFGFARHYREQYGAFPSMHVILDSTRNLAPSLQPIFQAVLTQVRETPVSDEPWLRDQVMDFIRRQVFRGAFLDAKELFNANRVEDAYDLMQNSMDSLRSVSFETTDRQWYMEELPQRHIDRNTYALNGGGIGTGIPQLDLTLGGGVDPGFLGVWLARPKAGKTTFLCNLGATALRSYHRRVLHIPLEGSGKYISDRYDTIFTEELYSNVRKGEIDSSRYSLAIREMEMLKQQCVIRAFTDGWEHNITHIWDEIRELKQLYGWEPDLIVVDYCDLLDGRPQPGGYSSETASQKASFQDLKNLATKGYAVWTASQVQRPRDANFDENQDLLKSKDIADCYAKVRIADMVGSLNQTREERSQHYMRLYVELLRDNASDVEILVPADFSRMKIGGSAQASMPDTMRPGGAATIIQKPLGYTQKQGV